MSTSDASIGRSTRTADGVPLREDPEYELYAGAGDGLRDLVAAGVEVHIITARWNGDPEARTKTEEWLASRGLTSGTHYNRIDAVKEGEKFAVDAPLDSFVDDNLVELLRMAEKRQDVRTLIVYDHPWNQTLDVGGRLHRVMGWAELVPLLLGELAASQERSPRGGRDLVRRPAVT